MLGGVDAMGRCLVVAYFESHYFVCLLHRSAIRFQLLKDKMATSGKSKPRGANQMVATSKKKARTAVEEEPELERERGKDGKNVSDINNGSDDESVEEGLTPQQKKLAEYQLRQEAKADIDKQLEKGGSKKSQIELFADADKVIRSRLFREVKNPPPDLAEVQYEAMYAMFVGNIPRCEALTTEECVALINRIPSVLHSRRSACDLAMKNKTHSKSRQSTHRT